MRMEFPYREESSSLFGKIYRPIAKVWFKGRTWMPAFMYVDSGADVTLIPKSFGELLGFQLESSKIQEIKGIGEGTVPVSQNIAWALIDTVPFLLGRLDILDKFDITFTEREVIFVERC
ncbi:MAG: hypothetical protein QMC77_06450 [Methanocellales archaeon]|nr:hypothetical protein [Methanocellales archaeon]